MAFNVQANWGMPFGSYSSLNAPTHWGNLALHQPEPTFFNAPKTGGYDCKFVFVQVCGDTTRQTGVSDLPSCSWHPPPSNLLWEGLLQSLPG